MNPQVYLSGIHCITGAVDLADFSPKPCSVYTIIHYIGDLAPSLTSLAAGKLPNPAWA